MVRIHKERISLYKRTKILGSPNNSKCFLFTRIPFNLIGTETTGCISNGTLNTIFIILQEDGTQTGMTSVGANDKRPVGIVIHGPSKCIRSDKVLFNHFKSALAGVRPYKGGAFLL
jgi:hypothetical protein